MKVNIEVQSLCVPPYEVRGIQNYILELTRSLVNRGVNKYSFSFFDYKRERKNRESLKLICEDFIDKCELFECNSMNYMEIIEGNYRGVNSYCQKGYELYLNSDSDLYHFPHTIKLPENIPEWRSIVSILDIIPLVDHRTQKDDEKLTRSFSNIMSFIKNRKDIDIISISEYTKNDIIKYVGIDERRIHVVPCGFNSKKYYPEENRSTLNKYNINKPFVLYLGALDTRKGIDTILDAVRSIKKNDMVIVIAGTKGRNREINNRVEKLNEKGDLIYVGYVNDKEKRELMSMAEMFVFPSFYEGFGLPVLEAMACGTPVITTSATSIPEVGGDSVLYFEAGNTEELVYQINRVHSSVTLQKKKTKNGLERSKQFTWDKAAELTEEVYNNVFRRL